MKYLMEHIPVDSLFEIFISEFSIRYLADRTVSNSNSNGNVVVFNGSEKKK